MYKKLFKRSFNSCQKGAVYAYYCPISNYFIKLIKRDLENFSNNEGFQFLTVKEFTGSLLLFLVLS